MRFLRMLTNSLLAGVLGAAYFTILVLQLNPQVFYANGWFAEGDAISGSPTWSLQVDVMCGIK